MDMDMDREQTNIDHYVNSKSKELVDQEIIKFFNEVHNYEVKIVHLQAKIVPLQQELWTTNLSLTTAHNFLNLLNESYRKIQREMPEKPQWGEVGQNDSFDTSMRTVLDGSEETRSETATNPYVVAGLSSGY